MKFKIIFFLSILICNLSFSQVSVNQIGVSALVTKNNSSIIKFDSLKISSNIIMPKDSLESKALLASINSFLSFAQDNSKNQWVLASQAMETQILIDEIHNIQKNQEFGNASFFKPHLTNIVPLENNKYAIHITYIGIHENSPILRANFQLIAHKTDNIFSISSPLKRNTQNWKSKKIQNQVFYSPYGFNSEKIQRIHELTSLFDKKLGNIGGESQHYLCTNEINPLKLFGVEYKSDYNGQKMNGIWETSSDKRSLYVMNASRFYDYPEHDLWHFRLSQVISRKEVHRRVDCHIGTLYGGLWGLSWEELFPVFCEEYVLGKNVDWLGHKENKSHFITKGRRKNYTDDFIGALLVKKIEDSLGFDGVWKLLLTERTKEEEEYFNVLEELIGINKDNYNKEVQKLIEEEMENLNL